MNVLIGICIIIFVYFCFKLIKHWFRDIAELFYDKHKFAPLKYKWRIFFASYDMWIGLFLDRKNSKQYICLIPCVVIERYPYCYYKYNPAYNDNDELIEAEHKCNKKLEFYGVDQYKHRVFKCKNDPSHFYYD